MNRQNKIIDDRVKMIKKALVKSGHLDGDEKEKTPEAFQALASGVLTDLLHLGVSEYHLTTLNGGKVIEVSKDIPQGFIESVILPILGGITKDAAKNIKGEWYANS